MPSSLRQRSFVVAYWFASGRMVAAPYPKLELPKEAVYETVKLGYALTLGRGC